MEPSIGDMSELAETFGIIGTIILFGMFILYQVAKDYFKGIREKALKAEKDNINQYIKVGYETMESINKFLKIATQQFNDEITKSQTHIIINKFFALTATKIIIYGLEVNNNNNIKTQQSEIRKKIELYVKNLWSDQENVLAEFKYKNKCLSSLIKHEQINEVSNQVIDIILKGKDSSTLVSYCENTFSGFINDAKSKINEY